MSETVAFVSYNFFQTFRRTLHQPTTNILINFFYPNFHYGCFQVCDVLWMFGSNFLFHNQPQVFYWVDVWTVARPFQDTDFCSAEECLHYFRGVARSILLENGSVVTDSPCMEAFLFHDFLVHRGIKFFPLVQNKVFHGHAC